MELYFIKKKDIIMKKKYVTFTLAEGATHVAQQHNSRKIAFTLANGATQRICTRTERSEFVQVSKTTLLRTVHNPRYVARQHNKRRVAFTLAEVLITLGIIGVVAAMTLPALIQHYKKQEASAKLKKFYSMMSQAILMSEAHNGPISDWNHPERLADKNNTIIENPEDRREFFNKYLKPYLKTVKSESTDEKDDTVILSDGSMIHLESGYCTGLLYDINGDKKPNVHGRDRFSFVICSDSFKKTYIDANHNFGVFYQSYASTKSRDELVNECKKEGNSNSCTVLLMYDNWEFKDDYPRKL